MSQLPDLFPVEGIFDPKPIQSDLPDIFPPGQDPATTGAMARQAAGMQAPQAVQDIQMSRKAGQDPGFVARNRDDIKLQLEVAGLEENLVGSPGVRAFIHKSPHHLAAAKDEIQGLADLERFLQKSGNTAMTIPKTLLKVGPQLAVTTNQALAMVAGQIDTAAQGLADMTGMEAGGLFGDIQQWLYDQNKPVEEYMEEYLSPSEEVQKPLWGNWELLADPEYLMTQTGDALVSFVPMVLGAAATGGSSVVAGVIGGFQEAASMYQDLIEEGVDPAQAGFWTPIFGTIVGKLNQIGFDKIMSANVAKSFLSRLYNRGVAGTTEALTEYAEEPAQAFLSSIARGDDWGTLVDNTLDSLKNVDVMVGAFFMGGGLHGSQLRRDVALARAKEQELEILDALTQNMEQSNLAKMDPQLYQEAVATLKEGGQIQEIFIPASAIATNTGSTNPGADMAVLTDTLNQLGVSMDAYQAALSSGQVVAVPVENYAAAVAADPAFAAQYAGDRKLSEDGLTRNERVQAEVEFQTEMANAVQMFKEDREATTVHEAEMQTIRDEVLAMRQATGLVKDTARQDAGTVAASFGAMARLTNGQFTPMQLWQKYGPQIQRGMEQEALAAQSLHQVPPDVARSLNYETKLPTDPIFGEAIANTPGAELLADGVELDLTRYQKEEQTGDTAVRTGVFYLPTGSAQEKYYRGGKNSYGGTVKVQGRTLLRAPLFVKGATGGKAPEAAYDSIFGKKAYSKMREDVLSAVSGWGLKEQAKVANIRALLDKYDANTVDAYEIYNNSREGNTLAYAIQENIVAHAVRRAGYDSVVGYSKKKDGGAFISEVFDVREMTNPDRTGYTDISDTFYQSLSTRLPSAVKSVEDPLNEVLTLDFNVALSDVKTLEKNMQALLATPNMRKPKGKGAKTPAKQAEMFIDHVVSNLLFLHDAMDPDMRSRAKLWYDGGRKTIEAWAERYGISEMQGASLIAVLSPQNGWFPNVSQAERIADIVFGMRDFRWDAAMSATAAEILKKDTSPDIMAAAEGKTLEEVLSIPNVAARWIRVYDQTHNSRAYRVLTPEGGAADFAKTNSGADATNAWKSYGTIAKGVSILLDGRAENVYYQIGQEHKVRNFYNNLFDPASPLGFTTIDTHAVAAAMLRPLAAADTEVLQAFGGTGSASSNVTGMNGTYPLYLEAYKRAAAARGLLPREMQSITWEAVRGLFEASKKKSLKQAANDIWLRYKDGEIEQEQAQQEIFELASGVTPPSWSTVPYTAEVKRTYDGPAQAAIDARDPAGKTESDGFRVFFEVAPDPNDAALTAEWDALPQDVKQAVSQQVAQAMVPKVLAEIGVSGSMDLQLGGYMGATNPSMALVLDRPELLISAAKLLGYTLAQDSMMVVSDRQSVGTQPVGAVTIDLPEGYGAKEVEALYDKLWELEQDGEKLVGGHTTANGHMFILNFSGIDTKALADIVDKHLGGAFVVADDEVFSAFIDKEAYQYDTNQQPTAARRTSVQGRANNLRNEATRLLRESLDAQGVRTLHQLAPVRGGGPQVFGGVDSQAVRAAYGSAVEGAESVTGIHYSREPRESLSGHFYGSGIKGAEARRLDLSSDVRLKKRIHFYVDTGSGIRPEPGVGANIHAVNLQNIYNVIEDPLGIVAAAYADRMKDPAQAANDMESAILDAGFDGYWNPEAQSTKGVAVLLGEQHTDVPVDLVQGPTLAQDQQQPKASFTFKTKSGRPLIELFEKADQSSFIHETGHLYLEMIRDMALQQDAPAAIAALWVQAKDALKIGDGQIPAAAHEQWARNLEAYFARGEAPALGLRGLFTKYSEWLRAVYREIENIFAGSGTTFNPALTPIFDRLFATERDMAEVEAFYAAQRPFFDAADGVAAADQERLDKLRNKAIEDSHAAHLRRLTEAYIKSQGGRKALADELRSEVESRPVYLAIEAARNGGFELGDIDHLVGEETRKAISKKWKIVKVGGDLDANVVAAQHGYDSAAAMLQEMATAITKQAALKVEVDARVEQERQKILRGLLDADTDVAADEAYHNDSRLALLVAEFALLAEKQSKQQGAMARALDAAAAREVAKQTLLGMPMKGAIDYKKFARAERKAAMQARDAKKAGKTKEALTAKRLELLNHALFMESMKLRGQVEKLGKAIKKGAKQKSMLPGAKDLLRTLGVQYGLMPYKKLKKGEAWAAYNQDMVGQDRATLAEWAAEREDEYGTYFDEFVLQNSAYVDIQNLTVDQFDQIRQAVNVIRTVDRHERTVLINGERLAMEEAEARLALSLEGRKLNSGQRSKRKSRFRKTFAHLHAFHAKMEALLLDLDGWEHGHWWNMFFRPIAEAENARSERMKIVGTKIHSLFDPIKKGMGKSVFIPEIQDSLQKSEILAIALNMGNEGNTLRLREGFPEWDLDALFQRMTQTEELLTAKDWKFVQSIWDYMDTFRDESFKLQKDLTGREPERVMPTPLATMHGVLAGGYYPAVYDTDLSFTAFSRDQKSLDESLFGGRNYGAAQTKHNHLKERAKTGASQAVSLELSVITDHLYNTVHDLTHRKAVVQVAKLMKRPAVRKMVEDALSPEAYREFMPWLQDVARERQDPTNQIIRLSRWARKGATIMNMGLKVTTMVTQPLGILQTVDLLGAEYTAVGLKHVYGNSLKIHKVYDQITEKSAFMANRIKSFDRDVRESMKGLTTVDTLRRQVDEFAFKGIGYMQLGVDLPTWWGAYQRGLSENLGDEAKAVAYADSIVRLSQSSGSMKDLARIQRGGELQRQFTMFYSYFSAFYQLAYRRVSKTKSVSDIPTAAASALMLWFLPAILSELVAGRGPDDDEEWWEWAMGNLLVYPFLTIGYVKEIASSIESGYDYQLSPSAGAPASLVKWARSVGKAIEEEEPERAVKPTIEAVGYALQLPLKQPVITLGNIWDYVTGEDPEFEVRDLFFVKPKARR